MSFLPIVERELRAGSRRKSTYRLRWWTALVAIFASVCWLILVWVLSARGNLGKAMFSIITGYTFALCLLAGIFLTSDCLSEEKREGTLGFLFLTDLKGYDVVLGKFAARSINAFYALLALFPLTGLPLLVGGVTGAEFGRMMLALLNALFFSLAIGTCISAFSRDAHNAMGFTVFALVSFFAGLPAFAAIPFLPKLWHLLPEFFSPFYPFLYSLEPFYPAQPGRFWRTLGYSHVLGWACLGIASIALPRVWQEGVGGVMRIFWIRPGRYDTQRRAKRNPALLDRNPILWLLGDASGVRRLVWIIVCIWGGVMFSQAYSAPKGAIWNYQSAKICAFLLKILFAAQACRFFVEARRSGALELLLCTPLRNVEILKGQWLALRRVFLWPLIVFLLLNLVPVTLDVVQTVAGQTKPKLMQAILQAIQGVMTFGWLGIGLLADFFAVGWFGMRIALTAKNPRLAFPLTVLCVLIIPSVGFCGLDMIADLFFILWGATSLHQDLRYLIGPKFQRIDMRFLEKASAVPPVLNEEAVSTARE